MYDPPPTSCDVAIVGAGAAGLAAGIFAAEVGGGAGSVCLLDGARKPGAKILVAGGGRCNVTHHAVDVRDYNAASKGFVKNVLKAFPVERTVEWLGSMGVTLKREDTGKLFPTTDKARTVLDALLTRLHDRGATLHAGRRVTGVLRTDDGFVLTINEAERLRCRRLIFCPGGRALPKTGSDGGGYTLARHLGHTVTPQHPALVSIVLQQHFFHPELAGISHEAEVTTTVAGKVADRRVGQMLWTHFGMSGPLVMDASRHFLAAKLAGHEAAWSLSLVPGERFEALDPRLVKLAEAEPTLTAGRALDRITATPLPQKLAAAVMRHARVEPGTTLAQLKKLDRRRLVHALVGLPLPVEQDRGWNHAEVTAGGVPLSEVSWRTMSSRVCDGLHLAGEVLDLDGRIGGFNFQWAWATGHLAGVAAARSLDSVDSRVTA